MYTRRYIFIINKDPYNRTVNSKFETSLIFEGGFFRPVSYYNNKYIYI